MNLLITLTTCARSNPVQTITYIKLPTTLAYGIRPSKHQTMVQKAQDTCIFAALGDFIGLANMPNFDNIF